MDLRQLEYVVAVADAGGFTAGAAAAHVAQPSLSQRVRSLEAELGVELFHRLGRGVVLSAAGETFVDAARQVLRDAAVLRSSVAAVGRVDAGSLDVAALPTLAVDPLAPLLGRFRQAHPGVTVRVLDPGDDVGVAALVRRGRAELGVTDLPVPGDDLLAVPLGDQELVAVSSPGLWSRPTGSLADLARLPLVVTPPGTSTRRVIDAALDSAGVVADVAVEVDQREAIVPLVLAGAGISFVPEAQARAAAAQGARIVRPRPRLTRAIGIVHRDRPRSPAADAFVRLSRSGR
jgi:DNA-binding transcriptional LysR family regulator